MKYHVSFALDVDDESPEQAAIQVDRLLQTTRPKDFALTPAGGKTVFVRVERGEAKRIA